MDNYSEILFEEAQNIANDIPEFLNPNGPGKGNLITNSFMRDLRKKMTELLSEDYSEKKISLDNDSAVDYYFPAESAIIEIALGLKKPNSEYEKDVLKAIMAKENGLSVKSLIFIAKAGAKKKCNQPARKSIELWLKEKYDIQLHVWELNVT